MNMMIGYEIMEPFSLVCSSCGRSASTGVIVGIDALCSDCRKFKHNNKKCCKCKRDYVPSEEEDWVVPEFDSYIDISYVCPNCLKKENEEYVAKKLRVQEIPFLIRELEKQIVLESPDVSFYNGDYYATFDDISFKQFKKAVAFYKKNEKQILKDNEIRAKISLLYTELHNLDMYVR